MFDSLTQNHYNFQSSIFNSSREFYDFPNISNYKEASPHKRESLGSWQLCILTNISNSQYMQGSHRHTIFVELLVSDT